MIIKNINIGKITIDELKLNKGINVFLGDNGIGKTTLLSYLYNYLLDKKMLNSKDIVYLQQHFNFYLEITVKDYITFVSKLLKLDINSLKKKCNAVFSEFVAENYNKKLLNLSGGQLKYLYISLVLYSDRIWYFLDEPYNELDKEKIIEIRNLIEDLYKNKGKNFIIVSHIKLPFEKENCLELKEIIKMK